jgi:hypothetical protein
MMIFVNQNSTVVQVFGDGNAEKAAPIMKQVCEHLIDTGHGPQPEPAEPPPGIEEKPARSLRRLVNKISTTMKNLFTLSVLLFFAAAAQAQFSGEYDATKWRERKSPGSTGDINYAYLPQTIAMNSSTGSPRKNTDVDFWYTFKRDCYISFTYEYATDDARGAAYDLFYFVHNKTEILASKIKGEQNQFGMITRNVKAGDSIAFRLRSTDNTAGNATVHISNFDVIEGPATRAIETRVYNNPTSGSFVIVTPGGGTYRLCNVVGQVLKTYQLMPGANEIGLQQFPIGVYYVGRPNEKHLPVYKM